MLKITQRSGKHFSCHLQGVMVGRFWQPYLYREGSRKRVGSDGADWRSHALKTFHTNAKNILSKQTAL
jgi:hypothetical protein